MEMPRAYHSATLLPDGRVLIFGGVGATGNVIGDAEYFDPASTSFSSAGRLGLIPRARHTATLGADGQLLVVGGADERNAPVDVAELWDSRTGKVTVLARDPELARETAAATLLSDGAVLIQGGEGANGKAANSVLIHPDRATFETIPNSRTASLVGGSSAQPLTVSGSVPGAEAADFAPDGLLALRFSKPIAVTSANPGSLVLFGPGGVVNARVTPSQDGMLAFISPEQPLLPGSRYTLFVDGVTAASGESIPLQAIGFDTARVGRPTSLGLAPSDVSGAQSSSDTQPARQAPTTSLQKQPANAAPEDAADDLFIPTSRNLGGRWRTGRPRPDFVNALLDHHQLIKERVRRVHSRHGLKRDAPRLGRTGVTGWVLKLNDQGLVNVEVSDGQASTRTNAQGRFELELKPGKHVLFVDGESAGTPGQSFAQVVLGVDVQAGEITELSHAIYLPRIRAGDWTRIPSPTVAETVVTHPDLPGLEVRIPAGAVIRDRKGKLVTRVAIVPFPLDRAPFVTPTNFPAAFLINPMGAVVQGLDPRRSPGIRVIYPNNTYGPPGTAANFWMYNPRERGWFVYGRAHITADGLQVAPDRGVAIFETLPVMYSFNSPNPPARAAACGASGQSGGDPVELCSGLFHHVRTDLAIADVIPLTLTRTYRPADTEQRGFGLGTSHNFAVYFNGIANPNASKTTSLIMPNGARVRFDPVGNYWVHTASPSEFQGAKLEVVEAAPYGYGWLGSLFRVTMKDGSRLLFTDYTAGGMLIAIIDRNGNRTDILRNGGVIERITSPNGRYVDVTTDASSRITQLRDISGRTWTYTYNTAGYLSRATYPDATYEEYTYDTSNRMLTVRDRRGNTMVTNEYDTNDRVTQQTLAENAVYQFAYTVDAYDRVTRTDVTDPRGKVHRFNFNGDGYKIDQTLALGSSEAAVYTFERDSASNRILSVTDPSNRVTAYTYDTVGNVLSVTKLSGTADAVAEAFTYEPTFNGLASRTDALNHTTNFTYDTSGNLTEIEDPLNNTVTLAYNSNGQVTTLTDPAAKITQFAYSLGDLVTITDPLSRTSTRETNTLGRVTAVSDPLGNRTQYAYDSNDRVTTITDPGGQATSLAYDANGNLTSVTDANGGVHQYTYDARNRRSGYTDPRSKSETYSYDGVGNLLSFTDRKSQLSTFDYDARNRRTLATYADTSTVGYIYDAVSRLTEAVDSVTGTITRAYDDLDRLSSETTPVGAVSYTYDAANRRTAMTVSGQSSISYGYDNADRLTSVTQGTTSVAIAYDAASRRTSLTLPSGIIATYTYDDASQLSGITYTLGASTIGDLSYTYDVAGNRKSASGSLASIELPAATTSTATYDAANRLTSWNSTTLTYDDSGNLTSDGTRTYTWDARNRLASLSGAATASFTYDALGRRLSRTVSGNQLDYAYDGLNPVQERSGGAVVANLLTGLGIDEYYARTDVAGARDFVRDALGSVVALADSSGALRTSYTYTPYGKPTLSGDTSSNTYQYTGRENDGTNLHYYRARYYDPQVQRFVSEDPLGAAAGVNFYAYVGGNPLSYTDPTGEVAWVVGGAVVGAAINVAATLAVSGGNATWQQIGAAAASGAIAGGVSALAGPLAGTIARSLGQSAAGALSLGANAVVSAGGGYAAQVVGNLIDPCNAASNDPFNSAVWGAFGAVGAGAIARSIPALRTPGMYTVNQANYFQPSTLRGMNQSVLINSYGVSAGLGAGSVLGWPF